ncbi:DUF397 domain-containing protein [Actinomadura hibisca]|uniref:DUF397 domain-containing protein n=1 Tax=Actinomadura hibisca TaxID=68565 RepID=UPI000A033E02|nr:DUF397 domain-containing protein [Actinomadura hibisca]
MIISTDRNAAHRSTLVAASWRKSSYSQGEGAECVELARIPAAIGIRDSKAPDGPALVISPTAARALANQIKDGELNLQKRLGPNRADGWLRERARRRRAGAAG